MISNLYPIPVFSDNCIWAIPAAKITRLKTNARVYCIRKYTMANLIIAKATDANYEILRDSADTEQQTRNAGIAPLPPSMPLAIETNPFLRFEESTLIQSAMQPSEPTPADEVEVFTALRNWKKNRSKFLKKLGNKND